MTRHARRIAIVLAGVLVLWLVVLLVLGIALGGSHGQGVADRMAESLKASGTIDDSDLALIRGRLALDGMRVRREDEVGKLALDVASVRCELPPFGIALVDRDCRELVIAGLRLEASSVALFKVQRPKRAPIHAGTMTIENAELTIPTPLGPATISIAQVTAGTTTFRTPLSWVFSLHSLDASVALPFGNKLDLMVREGLLFVRGNWFGDEHFSICPIAPPAQHDDDDAQAELKRLVGFGRELGDRIFGACQIVPVKL